MSTTEKRWSAAVLTEHWNIPCERNVWRIVEDQGVPFLYLRLAVAPTSRMSARLLYRA